jgi:16S rRNA (uracil1498-N3)-methyltransferase
VHRFYDPSISENSSVISATVLEDFKSLRIRDREELSITKGVAAVLRALVFNAAIGQSLPKAFHVLSKWTRAINLALFAKCGKDDAVLQTPVEPGVASITPLQATRSVVEWRAKAFRNRERRNQIAISAVKQSKQAKQSKQTLKTNASPILTPKQLVPIETGLAPDPRSSVSLVGVEVLKEVTVAAGPLRYFSQGELDNLEAQGFLGVRLGSSVLPNSMAGPAAVSPLMALSGHWS